MKNCITLFSLLLLFVSCKKETNTGFNKKDKSEQESNKVQISQNVQHDLKLAPVDFLEKKYKNSGYNLPDSSPTFPNYSFTDKDLGMFSVNFIGKTALIQDYWSVTNSKGFFSQFEDIDRAMDNSKLISEKVDQILNQKMSDYFIIADFLPKESVLKYFNDGSGEFELKKDAYTYFYIYENNRWVFIKRLLTNKIDKEGILLYNDLLSDKLKKVISIAEKFQGKFIAEADGEYTENGVGHTTYYFTITKYGIVLKSEAFNGDFLCQGNYKGIEKNDILELYYDENDNRCKKGTPNYFIKKDRDSYFIKGIGGEGTIKEWIKLDKK